MGLKAISDPQWHSISLAPGPPNGWANIREDERGVFLSASLLPYRAKERFLLIEKSSGLVPRIICSSMRRWGKGRANDDSDGSGDERPAKKAAKKDDDDTGGITVCELSGHRKVSVRSFKGKVYVDIREYYTKDGRDLPGKKGISLSLDQWDVLRDNIAAIDKAVKESE